MLLVIININAHAQASAESLPAELSRVDFPRKFQENPKTLRSDSIRIITIIIFFEIKFFEIKFFWI